ncbi:MAG: permease-like cell division protein FtsX [Thermodesulfobacteriota bacterium]
MLSPRLMWRGVRDLTVHPWAQALTLAAVTLVAFLGGLFLLVLHNLDRELAAARGSAAFQVYWKPGIGQAEIAKQWEELAALPGLADIQTFTPDQALSDLMAAMKGNLDAGALAALKGQNPLPPTALLVFDGPSGAPGTWAKDMVARLSSRPGVDRVSYNPLQMDLARSWSGFTRTVAWPLMAFLALVVGLSVGNTVRLSLLSRQNEVDILQLVGAGRWYIQLPLLTGGAAQGLAGSGLALAMLKALQAGVADLFAAPPLQLAVRFLPAPDALLLAATVTGVCILASVVAMRE